MDIFKINQRQNKALTFQLTALFISWICGYLTNFTFGIFMLTELLTAGALIYSNDGFLKYKLSRCILISVVLVVLFSFFQSYIFPFLLIWFIQIKDPEIIQPVSSYILITVILKITQKQVKIGLFQLLTVAALLLIYFVFSYNNPAFSSSLKGYYIPFFINQFFISIYAASMLTSEKEEVFESTLIKTEIQNTSFQKNTYKFLKFTILAIVGVGILFLLVVSMLAWIFSGVNFDR